MIFKHFNFDDPDAVTAFTVASDLHKPTWGHYYTNYNKALTIIFNKGLSRNYALNCRCRPVLFLVRHSLELCLKANLERLNQPIPTSHNFIELLRAFPNQSVVPEPLIEILEMPLFDGDGSSFRYYNDKYTGKPFFSLENECEMATILEKYNSIQPRDFLLGNVTQPFDYQDKRKAWDLTFHLGECTNLGQIRTQYDETIEFLIEGVLLDHIDITDIYLPLLFLVRHSLELALKANIIEIQGFSELMKSKDYSHEHSLHRLYGCYADYLNKLELLNLPERVQVDFLDYKAKYNQLNAIMHDLDVNSRYFRYPVDKNNGTHKLSLKSNSLIDLLKLYYFSDPFITFTNTVLEEQGALK
jgi:HEPN domain-containing protein